jgi:sec-independent protein translocase protein TatB
MGMQPPIQMANLGMADSLIIMVLALVVFGPRKLPQIGRQIGKLMYEFRKASNDFKFQMEEELRVSEDADRRKVEEERSKAAMLAAAAKPMLSETPAALASEPATMASPEPSSSVPGPAFPETHNPHPDLAPSTHIDAPIAETAAEETYPLIKPPSTGEQVPGSRPFNASASPSAPHEPTSAAPEQAAHHG